MLLIFINPSPAVINSLNSHAPDFFYFRIAVFAGAFRNS